MTPEVTPAPREEFTITVPAATRVWRTIDWHTVCGFDDTHIYLDCTLEAAQSIARQLGAQRLQRGQWPRVHEKIRMEYLTCDNCQTTGTYRWGPSINGKPPLYSGQCYQCEGKGFQSDDDQRRNWGYMNRAIVRAFRAV